MPNISISTHLPVGPAQAFTHVTAFPAHGDPDPRLLEDKYGSLESHEGTTYTFRDKSQGAHRWSYAFDPPHRREIKALDSDWSDRIDTFEPFGDGTQWSITWQPKSQGAPVLLRWLFFQLKDKKVLYEQIMQPVEEQLKKQEFY